VLRTHLDRAAAVFSPQSSSGNTDPSSEDRQYLENQKASDVLGINLLDHIIFSGDGYYSFLEHGEI
jgi:DNA repair protein RadC